MSQPFNVENAGSDASIVSPPDSNLTAISPPPNETNTLSSYPKEFDEWANKIQTLEKGYVALKSLLDAMTKNQNVFTETDFQVVNDKLTYMQTEIPSKKKDLERRIDVWENQIKRIQMTMQQRKQILEAEDAKTQVLQMHTDILDYFVNGHAQLEENLKNFQDQNNATTHVTK